MKMNIAEAKAKLSELIARAEAGEEVIIARDGAAAVVLRPANDAKGKRLGLLAGMGELWEAPDAWNADDEAADFAERATP